MDNTKHYHLTKSVTVTVQPAAVPSLWPVLILLVLLSALAPASISNDKPGLIKLAQRKFGILTPAEQRLFLAAANGKGADYSTDAEEDNDPADANNWGPERTLKADRIEWLCTDKQAVQLVTNRGIIVKGAHIDGNLYLIFAKIPFPLFLLKCVFPGEIYLRHTELAGLYLGGTHTGPITADGLSTKGDVSLNDSFKATGKVDLIGATIGGDLDCRKGTFINKEGDALNAERVDVRRSMYLRDAFHAEGRVSLLGAVIGGDLDCNEGTFINEGADALKAGRVDVKGAVFLSNGFRAEGEVSLLGATVGKGLVCQKGTFINKGANALNAARVEVKGNTFLHDGFRAQGTVNLVGATIAALVWTGVDSPEEATLDLSLAKIGTLQDEPNSWPKNDNLLFHGLVYDRLSENPYIKSRINWLRLQPEFLPQPYEQLAAVLRKSGHEEDAKKILIAKNKDKARLTKVTWGQWWWYRLFGPMIGYGYRPWRAFWIGTGVVILGWFLFAAGFRANVMTPAKDGAYGSTGGGQDRQLSQDYPKFSAAVYSLDVFVPLVDLHQASYWLPNANKAGQLHVFRKLTLRVSGSLIRWYFWFQIIAGWVLTTMLVVGLTGLVRT